MSFLWAFTYGPGYLEYFLDLFAVVFICDVIALLLFARFLWNATKVSEPEKKQLSYYDNSTNIINEEAVIDQGASKARKSVADKQTQTVAVATRDESVEADVTTKIAGVVETDDIFSRETSLLLTTSNIPDSMDDQGDAGKTREPIKRTSSSSSESSLSQDEVTDVPVNHPPGEMIGHQGASPESHLLVRHKSRDDINFTSGWRKNVKLIDLLRAKLINEQKILELERAEVTEEEVERELKPFLIGRYPIAGIYNDRTEKKMSLLDAHTEGLISRGTALSLLEAQAANGSIADPLTGEQMSVDEAYNHKLLDRHFASVLTRAERAVHGYKVRGTDEVLSLFQAMQRGLVVENHGIRLLEAQIATGGIIDPVANIRLPVETAYERGLFDEKLHRTLEDPNDDTKGFLDPNTNENLTYLDLIERCVEDTDTNLLLLPIVRPEDKKLYKERQISLSSSIQSRISSPGRRSPASSTSSLGD